MIPLYQICIANNRKAQVAGFPSFEGYCANLQQEPSASAEPTNARSNTTEQPNIRVTAHANDDTRTETDNVSTQNPPADIAAQGDEWENSSFGFDTPPKHARPPTGTCIRGG